LLTHFSQHFNLKQTKSPIIAQNAALGATHLAGVIVVIVTVSADVFEFRMLERLAGVVSRPLTMEQLSVVKAILDHVIIMHSVNNNARYSQFIS